MSNAMLFEDKLRLITEAIRDKKQVQCTAKELYREFCPHILGLSGRVWMTLVWQFAGESEKGLPDEGGWRCFRLDDIEGINLHRGIWHRGFHTGKRDQYCVKTPTVIVDEAGSAEIR